MRIPTDPAERKALYAQILARVAAEPPASLTDEDRDYLRDRAYDQSKVSDAEAAEERASWGR